MAAMMMGVAPFLLGVAAIFLALGWSSSVLTSLRSPLHAATCMAVLPSASVQPTWVSLILGGAGRGRRSEAGGECNLRRRSPKTASGRWASGGR